MASTSLFTAEHRQDAKIYLAGIQMADRLFEALCLLSPHIDHCTIALPFDQP